MSTRPDEQPTLREHLEAQIAHESDLTRARFEAMDKALLLQSQAIEVHLRALNGEQSRLAADRERFLPRESHDLFRDDFRKWQDSVNAQLAVSAGRDRGVSIAWSVGLAGLTLGLAVAGVVITLLLRGG